METSHLAMFADLSPEQLDVLRAAFEPQALSAGAVLFAQDEQVQAFYTLLSGTLQVTLAQPDGRSIVIQDLGPGECLGELPGFTVQQHGATIHALTDAQLLRLPQAAFEQLAEQHPDLIPTLFAKLLPRFQEVQGSRLLLHLFGPLDEALLRALRAKIEWRRLKCGQILCHEGAPGDEMYIVAQGRLRFAANEGGQLRDLGEVGIGESIGEFALLSEADTASSRRTATVYAIRQTDVMVITRADFEQLLYQAPQALLKLTRGIIQREVLVAQAECLQTSAQVIAVLPLHPEQHLQDFSQQLVAALNALGATLFLDPARFEQLYGGRNAAQTPCDHPLSLLINTWLDERESAHKYAVYEAYPAVNGEGHLTPWAQRCLEDADVILLVADSHAAPARGVIEAAIQSAHPRGRVELALLHPAAQVPTNAAAWLTPRQTGALTISAHHHVRLERPSDFRRLSRRLSGQPVGLVLGGGGARGWAHVGVIQALEEAQIEVDWVGGASIGAIMAAIYALEWSPERMRQLAGSFSDPKKLLDYTLPYTSLTATRRITTLLQKHLGPGAIEDTWRPYFCVSSNLTHGQEQLHLNGTLWKAVRASMAFPAVFAPVLDNGCVLIDGGAANNVPVDRMRELCPTGVVIGVELRTSSPAQGPYSFGPSLSGWEAWLGRWKPFGAAVNAPNLLNIVDGIVYSNNRYRLNEVGHCADLLLRIPVQAYSLLEFDKYAELIELGYTAAQTQLQNFHLPCKR